MTKYVSIETPNYNGKKCGIAQIIKRYSSKKSAEKNTPCGVKILTEKQAEKFIKKWNYEFEKGNYNVNF